VAAARSLSWRARGAWALRALGVVALVLFVLERRGEVAPLLTSIEQRFAAPAPAQRVVSEPLAARLDESAVSAELAPLPETFDNTSIDGGFRLDERGHLVPTESALRFFGYFFSASGKLDEAQILARIEAEIRRLLKPPADAEALALLRDYVGYRHAGRELALELEDASADQRVDALYALRRESFGPERAARLFERDELLRDVAMERARIARDDGLAPAERAAALAAAEADLPEGLRKRRAYSTAAARAYETEQALRAAGASEAEQLEARTAALGEEGARRMQAVDAEERAFQAALDELAARAAAGGGESDLEAFIAARFAERDRARARALLFAGFPAH
jgi:lipase chaperone LimK